MKKFFLLIIVISLLFASIIYITFKWGSEFVGNVIANAIPMEIQKKIGEASIKSMEIQELEESSLPAYTQNKIKQKFFDIISQDSSTVILLFKNANYPNAFALPGNYIILLDSLVKMSKDTINYSDVTGVLAHEAGHLHHKHSLKLMIKSGLTAAVISYFIGDFSILAATLTQQLLSLSYSREYEEQADEYAIRTLNAHKVSTLPLADLLERMSNQSIEQNIPEFLSTHPVTKERVKKLRENKY